MHLPTPELLQALLRSFSVYGDEQEKWLLRLAILHLAPQVQARIFPLSKLLTDYLMDEISPYLRHGTITAAKERMTARLQKLLGGEMI